MTKRHQPAILCCDHCGVETEEGEGIGWVGVARISPLAHWVDPLEELQTFCSAQHAALFLIGIADRWEVLGHEMMSLLGRVGQKETE